MTRRIASLAGALPVLALLAACQVSIDGLSCSGRPAIHGSGVSAVAARTVPAFDRVHFSGSGRIEARAGEAQSLTITADDNLLDSIESEVVDGELRIGFKSGSYQTSTPLVVSLAAPRLAAIHLSGSGEVVASGLSGEQFTMSISGSGNASAMGQVDRLEVQLSGSGDMDFDGLEAREASVQVSGSGDVRVHATQRLHASVSGSGDVHYRGDPQTNFSCSGSGKLVKD